MYTRLKDLKDNLIENIDFSVSSFDEKSAREVSDALMVNTSVKEIDIRASTFRDEELATISKAIIERPAVLEFLNLRHNDLITDNSIHVIENLIATKVGVKS